jgi:hypothetical protein
MMNLMKNAFLLLALFAGTVAGSQISAEVEGVEAYADSWCSPDAFAALYTECVVETAEGLGAVFGGRRELRGNRELQGFSCSVCPPNPPKGHFCWVMCSQGSRRLTVADEHADRRLVTQGEIQVAATECYEAKATDGYPCLGPAGDITVTVAYEQ